MTKRQKRGCILVLAGLLMVLCALALHLADEKQDSLAGENAELLLRQLKLNKIEFETEVALPDGSAPDENQPASTAMAEKSYLGYSMIGTIRIRSVGIELPVMSSWSYELLNIAPCRYYGSIPEGNMILMGHNYKSHFISLHEVQIGAEVEFEDVNGVIYHYVVADIEKLGKNDGKELLSEYPLTIFTCTASGTNRVVVRCEEK